MLIGMYKGALCRKEVDHHYFPLPALIIIYFVYMVNSSKNR